MSDLFSQDTTPQVTLVPDTFATSNDFLSLKSKAKELGKELDWVLTQRKSEYLKEVLNLQGHPSVAIRRKVASGLAKLGGKEIIDSVKLWQQSESDRQTWLILQTLADKLERGIEVNKQTDIKVLTVSEALIYIKKLLGEETYYIEGELSEVRPFRNMYYFALKDQQDGRLNCWAFEKVVERIDFPFNEGLSVRLTGKFKLSKDSKLYFETQHIQLTGEGELFRNLKLLEEKLQKEGLFDPDRKRPIPRIPQNILLVASTNSAALTDFMKVLGHRRGGMNVHLLPIKTQGVGAEALILEQLEKINTLTDRLKIDTVVLTRGGGSQDDLFVFNSEKIVRALHGLNRPTVVAIGHERDTTLAELVSDLRCSTPSQAAEKVSLSRQEINYQASGHYHYIYDYTIQKKHQYQNYTYRVLTIIRTLFQSRIDQAKYICNRTGQLAGSIINQTRFQASQSVLISKQTINQRITDTYCDKDNAWMSINSTLQASLAQSKARFELLNSQIFLHDPKNILAKGYALILQDGQCRENITQIESSRPVQIRMQDGEITINN